MKICYRFRHKWQLQLAEAEHREKLFVAKKGFLTIIKSLSRNILRKYIVNLIKSLDSKRINEISCLKSESTVPKI